ncbi:MAG: filamentous hemagglutinin N-terminal domain-containing protein [Myxococcota bacterium]
MALFISLGIGLTTFASVASAQSSIATDDTLAGVAARDLVGPDYLVTESDGVRAGNNQFHSFERFGLATDETVTFSGPDAIETLIMRVTGGASSGIDGQITSSIDGADLYLINPAGVVFTENAQLDVPGNVVISTADHVSLGDDGVFSASSPLSSVLSASPVSEFGFLSSSPASIEVAGSALETQFESFGTLLGRSLSLIGGDIDIRGSGEAGELTYLYSRGGRINLASMGSAGTVEIVEGDVGEPADLRVVAEGELGDVFVGDGAVVVSGGPPPDNLICYSGTGCSIANGSGDIFVRARNLTLEDGEIRALTVTDRDAGRIDIDLTGDLVARSLNETETTGIFAISGLDAVLSDDGPLTLTETLNLPEGPFTLSVERTFGGEETRITYPGTGRGGDIEIRARNVTVEGFAEISSEAVFGGDAGNITIDADELVEVSAAGRTGDFGSILTNARGGGDGGIISISGQELSLTENGRILSEVREGAGRGGSISIDVDRLIATADGRIDSSTRGTGDGGDISILASESVLLSGQVTDGTFSGVSTLSQADGTGNAGRITIETPELSIEDGARVTTTALASGDAGTLDLRADVIKMRGASVLAESELGLGGDIYVNGGPIAVSEGGRLSISTPEGVSAGSLLLLSDSTISTSVRGAGASGGDVAIRAEALVLVESEILAQAIGGAGGNMRIESSAIVLDEPSQIDASSFLSSQDGIVETTSPVVTIQADRPDVPVQVRDATGLLRERCAARNGDAAASLVLRGRSGLPPSPGGLLSATSSLIDDLEAPVDEASVALVAGDAEGVPSEAWATLEFRLGCQS